MGIRLLYGLKTADQSYLDVFHPARRLKQAALQLSLDYQARLVNLGDLAPFHPAVPDTGTHHEAWSELEGWAKGHHVLLRGDLPEIFYERLDSVATSLTNSWPAVSLCADKLAAAGFFREQGVAHPATMMASSCEGGQNLPFAYPVVLKPRFGKKGYRVQLIDNPGAWAAYHTDPTTLIQEYVAGRPGADIRFFFAAFRDSELARVGSAAHPHPGRPGLASLCVLRQAEGFASNAAQGGHMSLYQPPELLLAEAQSLFLASGLRYGTVDFLFRDPDGRDFMVCEMNSCPGFEELEKACPVDAAQAILRSIPAGQAIQTQRPSQEQD